MLITKKTNRTICAGLVEELVCLTEIRSVIGDEEGRLTHEEIVERIRELSRANSETCGGRVNQDNCNSLIIKGSRPQT